MLDQKPLNKILFLDIETTSQKENFSELTEHQQKIFIKRFKKDIDNSFELKFKELLLNKPSTTKGKKSADIEVYTEESKNQIHLESASELYNQKAPIFPEFGKILCISIGVLWKNFDGDDYYNIKIVSFANEDEKVILSDFVNHPKLGSILNKLPGKYEKNLNDYWALCAHNGRVFDFPFIAKRLIINGFQLPAMFDYAHLKPWEQNHIIDTKESWSFGVWDSMISLDTLSDIFGTDSSKDDMCGSEVKDVFWKEKDLPKIVKYCEKDVVALTTNYLRMKSMQEKVVVHSDIQQVNEADNQQIENKLHQDEQFVSENNNAITESE
jgi:hypothetical protein